jgi:vancomycin permeability regulator SanA
MAKHFPSIYLMRILRSLFRAVVFLLCLALAGYAGIRWEISKAVEGRIFTDAKDAPVNAVAMVLGAEAYTPDIPSPALAYRLDAAIQLYKDGKSKLLLMSGDGREEDYNEITTMTSYATEHGVPASAIIADPSGLRTYDSCRRARSVYGLTSLTVVSQYEHLRRAVYTCRALGIDAVGVVGAPFYGPAAARYFLREQLAQVLAWFDVHLIHPN